MSEQQTAADTSRADPRDMLERIEECVGKWPGPLPPGAPVTVRADLVTLAYVEIEELRNIKGQLVEALRNVRKIITDGAMVGFNCHDGDWAERLFASQQMTSTALRKATGAAS